MTLVYKLAFHRFFSLSCNSYILSVPSSVKVLSLGWRLTEMTYPQLNTESYLSSANGQL